MATSGSGQIGGITSVVVCSLRALECVWHYSVQNTATKSYGMVDTCLEATETIPLQLHLAFV